MAGLRVTYSLDIPRPEAFKALYDRTGWGDHELDAFERALEGSWLVASARRGDVLVGIGRVISDGALHAFVTEMIIDERFRGRGIGAELLRMLVERTVERGITDVQLFAAAGRRPFYERNGFEARPDDAPGMQLAQPAVIRAGGQSHGCPGDAVTAPPDRSP